MVTCVLTTINLLMVYMTNRPAINTSVKKWLGHPEDNTVIPLKAVGKDAYTSKQRAKHSDSVSSGSSTGVQGTLKAGLEFRKK